MRAVVQKVSHASVVVDGELIGEIAKGLLVLLAFTHDDTTEDIDWMIRKLTRLRIFEDAEGKMNLSVEDMQGDLLIVSQFTLYADSTKGNRPSFIQAAPPAVSIPLYEQFLQKLRAVFAGRVETGRFGADMKVSLVNEGPVTIILDSPR